MSRVWFARELETVASWWRILRRDGVALGFVTHDADLWFDGVRHRAAPGITPSAIRRSADLQPDSAEVEGAITHAALAAADLAAGRFDGAAVLAGVVDWETLERAVLWRGTIGGIAQQEAGFTATLESRKQELERDPVPRTSPTCRAEFCGPGCGLSGARFTHEAVVRGHVAGEPVVLLAGGPDPALLVGGWLRWLDGPLAGLSAAVMGASGAGLMLDGPVDLAVPEGARVQVREGCDRTLDTCATRFGNAVQFQGEPFVPGNDLLARYGAGR